MRQIQHISGLGPESNPALRNSHELYLLFEEYFALYFPQGGSTLPPFVMTEKSITLFSESAAAEFSADNYGLRAIQGGLTVTSQPQSSTASRPPVSYIPPV